MGSLIRDRNHYHRVRFFSFDERRLPDKRKSIIYSLLSLDLFLLLPIPTMLDILRLLMTERIHGPQPYFRGYLVTRARKPSSKRKRCLPREICWRENVSGLRFPRTRFIAFHAFGLVTHWETRRAFPFSSFSLLSRQRQQLSEANRNFSVNSRKSKLVLKQRMYSFTQLFNFLFRYSFLDFEDPRSLLEFESNRIEKGGILFSRRQVQSAL